MAKQGSEKTRKSSDIVSPKINSESQIAEEFQDASSNVEGFEEFAERLFNSDSFAVSEESAESVKMDKNSSEQENPADTSYQARVAFLIKILIPIFLGFAIACWLSFEPHVPTDDNIIRNPALFKDKPKAGGSMPKPKKVEISWRKELETKGSSYSLVSEEDIKYNKGGPMYLVVAGHVFDVSSGGKMYQEGSGYHGFVGKDGTRAFVTGQFDDKGLVPSLDGLSPEDHKGVSGWIDFYLNHDSYEFVGILKGWYFDENGKPTNNLKNLIKNVDLAEKKEEVKLKVEEQFPTCNVEWTAASGSRVWCSAGSGGIQRSWVGLPRVFTEGGRARCACVRDEDLNDSRLSVYKGCSSKAIECKILE